MGEIRAGDEIRLGHERLLAAGQVGDRVRWCGWPPGEVARAHVELVRRGTPEEHRATMWDLRASGGWGAYAEHACPDCADGTL